MPIIAPAVWRLIARSTYCILEGATLIDDRPRHAIEQAHAMRGNYDDSIPYLG